ncbi:MAG: leucyl aminopeptidase [Acidimicrobiales bacterium]|jgi:leucyl aminopeptidase
MPQLTLSSSVPRSATAVDVPVASDELDQLSPAYRRSAELAGFEGGIGQTLALTAPVDEPVSVLVGVGPRSEISADVLRQAAAAYVRSISNHQAAASTLAEAGGGLDATVAIAAVTEGIGLASYSYTAMKSSAPKPTLRKVSIVGGGRGVKAAFTIAAAAVEAVALARDLTNEPGGSLTPVAFVARARRVAKAAGLSVSVWDQKRIEKERFGGLLSVNKGSTHPPRFLVLDYKPSGTPTGSVALVGKGITFDSGGLSIKSGAGMMTMKIDMAGGAAVLGAISLLPALGSKVAATAYIPLTDNMINGDATRPGDVFTARNGKTVEVLNTDAEGRLVLADALSYASEKKHDAIIDIATLTGAVSAALGSSYAGVMGNNDQLLERLEVSAATSGEKIWRLPLPAEYRKQLDSPVADLKNIGSGPYGGALTAGLFLSEFVDADTPWAHIDLGLSAMADADDGVTVKGGTGYGVRLLADVVTNWSS